MVGTDHRIIFLFRNARANIPTLEFSLQYWNLDAKPQLKSSGSILVFSKWFFFGEDCQKILLPGNSVADSKNNWIFPDKDTAVEASYEIPL